MRQEKAAYPWRTTPLPLSTKSKIQNTIGLASQSRGESSRSDQEVALLDGIMGRKRAVNKMSIPISSLEEVLRAIEEVFCGIRLAVAPALSLLSIFFHRAQHFSLRIRIYS